VTSRASFASVPPIAGTIASDRLVFAQIAFALLAKGRFELLLPPHPATVSPTTAIVAAKRTRTTGPPVCRQCDHADRSAAFVATLCESLAAGHIVNLR